MKRGVKRPTQDLSSEVESSPDKKVRVNANLLKFEQMKKEAEENRRRVRDEYLKDQEKEKNQVGAAPNSSSKSRRDTIDVVPSSRTPTKPRKTPTKKSEASSTKATKTPPKKSEASSTKPTKTPTKKTETSASKPAKTSAKKTDTSTKPSKTSAKKSDASSTKPSKAATKKSEVLKSTAPCVPPPQQAASPMTHFSSVEDEEVAAAEVLDDKDWCGNLYPTIALSDAVNAVGHLCGAFVVATNGFEIAAFGFLSVWLAAIVGVLRFGVSEKLFQQANSDLANLAGFVGYPLIGMSFAAKHYKELDINETFIGFMLVAWEALTRSFVDSNKESAKLATNIIFFVGPIAAVCHDTQDFVTMACLAAFVVAGIVITPHHENRIAGVRCVDWFHVIIGVTAYMFATGLVRV